MRPDQRIVGLPVAELWDSQGVVATERMRPLAIEDIRALLRLGPVRFVVANPGHPLRWIAQGDRFAFWKTEVQAHLASFDQSFILDDFPDGLAYIASEWAPRSGTPVVLLESYH